MQGTPKNRGAMNLVDPNGGLDLTRHPNDAARSVFADVVPTSRPRVCGACLGDLLPA